MTKKPDPYLFDDDNPPLTSEEIKNLRPATEVLEEQKIEMPSHSMDKAQRKKLSR